ncbi:unnamed protein product [Mucor hiemalis]
MIDIKEIVLIYLLGGVTFIPIILVTLFFLTSTSSSLQKKKEEGREDKPHSSQQQEKKGWIRLTKQYKPKGSLESNVAVLMSGIQSYVQGSKRQKEHVFAVLKCGALFIYESDGPQEECKIIIPVHNYNVSIYPEKSQDNDIFSRSIALKLTPKNDDGDGANMEVLLKSTDGDDTSPPYLTSNNELFITCARPVDKEDWYFGLLAATQMMSESPNNHVEMIDVTRFDDAAMQTLISTVQQDAEYREVQWLNAILGRLFLGMYKTEEMRLYFQEKITKKIQKIKRPSFLGEISVQSVVIGDSIPFVTQPKLLSLTPEGDLMAEATVNYAGGLCIVIETDFNWTYSSLMKPIRVPLVLSVTLKKMSGKFLLKVKPPPTNRYWIGFYKVPDMEWAITPIVSDKQIRLSMVTNAIQAKIREFMMENVVLPNMDDFPFCPSDGKGGIFGERVPKPSSPKETSPSPPLSMNLDMLGNKLNTKVLPKVVVSSYEEKIDFASPKPRRAESVHVFDSSKIVDMIPISCRSKSITPTSASNDNHHLSSIAKNKPRGYSNPDLMIQTNDANNEMMVEKEMKEANSPSIAEATEEPIPVSTPSFTRRFSYNLAGFRKRHQQLEALTEDDSLVQEPESYFPLDKSNQKEEILAAVATEATLVNEDSVIIAETTESKLVAIVNEVIPSTADTDIAPFFDIMDDSQSIKSNKSGLSSKLNLLSKITSGSISNKIASSTTNIKIVNKKNALYNMAGNIFNKKASKVTREMKDERNRELQESHNRKMMNLFINNEPPMQQLQPPPLPPRRIPPSNLPSSLSSLSSDEDEEETSPVIDKQQQQVSNDFKQHTEEVVIVNHGLSI